MEPHKKRHFLQHILCFPHTGALDEGQYNSPLVAVIVCIVILTFFVLAMAVYFGLYVRRRKL